MKSSGLSWWQIGLSVIGGLSGIAACVAIFINARTRDSDLRWRQRRSARLVRVTYERGQVIKVESVRTEVHRLSVTNGGDSSLVHFGLQFWSDDGRFEVEGPTSLDAVVLPAGGHLTRDFQVKTKDGIDLRGTEASASSVGWESHWFDEWDVRWQLNAFSTMPSGEVWTRTDRFRQRLSNRRHAVMQWFAFYRYRLSHRDEDFSWTASRAERRARRRAWKRRL